MNNKLLTQFITPFSDPTVGNDYYTYDYKVPENVYNSLAIELKKLNKVIEKNESDGPLFRIKSNGILSAPIADIHHERYIIYKENTKAAK